MIAKLIFLFVIGFVLSFFSGFMVTKCYYTKHDVGNLVVDISDPMKETISLEFKRNPTEIFDPKTKWVLLWVSRK